ncbi:PEP-CTERM sorting domain-containing protein [Roseateles cellulosilyticus]|uniref:PEP-CTERM sorting domain-containing protein n=1 Tax=Pelomonas cellulosilytica TaxID=2906762 RepID=A0ABS8Y1P5_9BURK|nr:PEP-CTERM sorting domain-containing protein [Pelomonas sp. P8]MCE4558157.1 PEP-CTERM sorting domain-containing protein [Pelomonas sp. P8]
MKHIAFAASLLAVLGAAQAHETDYTVTTTWFEPQTQPKNTIFQGSFTYDEHTHTITGLTGQLSESMTGDDVASMVWLPLTYQLQSWYDASLGGTFAAVFKNSTTTTFCSTALCGSPADDWSPQTGVDVGGIYAGFPKPAKNPGNAYALIFVPETPTAALTQAQISKLAYADCTPTAPGGMMMGGGMMGAVCMTGTSLAGYGATGTMDGYPLSQTIAAAVPEPETYALMLAGLGVLGTLARRRARSA